MTDPTRRSVLKRGSALAGTGLLAGLAGCSSVPGFGSGGSTLQNYVYEPTAVGDGRHGYVIFSRPEQIASAESEFDSEFYADVSEENALLSATGVDYDAVSETVTILPGIDSFADLVRAFLQGPTRVATADFETDQVTAALDGAGYSESGSAGEFTLYENEDGNRTIGVGDGSLATARDGYGATARAKVEAAIAAGGGDEDRYGAESDDFSLALDRLGSGEFRTATTFDAETTTDTEAGTFTGRVAEGVKLNVDGERTTVKYVHVFESGEEVDTADVESWVDYSGDNDGYWSPITDDSTSKNGRTAVTTAEIETDRIDTGVLLI